MYGFFAASFVELYLGETCLYSKRLPTLAHLPFLIVVLTSASP
jgi:hypothetical protein